MSLTENNRSLRFSPSGRTGTEPHLNLGPARLPSPCKTSAQSGIHGETHPCTVSRFSARLPSMPDRQDSRAPGERNGPASSFSLLQGLPVTTILDGLLPNPDGTFGQFFTTGPQKPKGMWVVPTGYRTIRDPISDLPVLLASFVLIVLCLVRTCLWRCQRHPVSEAQSLPSAPSRAHCSAWESAAYQIDTQPGSKVCEGRHGSGR